MRILSTLLIAVIMLGFYLLIFTGENPFPYKKEYIELYTTAVYSIPHAEGFKHNGEVGFSPDIYIWEQDDYGRTLFAYCEDYSAQVYSLVVCQAYDDTNAYFYPEVNYALTLIDRDGPYTGPIDELIKHDTEGFYLEIRDQLKEANDWNQPLDQAKCVSYPITDHKILDKDAFDLSEAQCDEILYDHLKKTIVNPSEDRPHRYDEILQIDAEGRILHHIYGIHDQEINLIRDPEKTETTYYMILWVITDKDGNYDKENGVMVMCSNIDKSDTTFIYDAKDILEFKARNGWVYGNGQP